MVREIIQIQVGSCGNYIGYDFLNSLCKDHCLNEYGVCSYNETKNVEKLDTYFNETNKETYQSRTVLVDTKVETLDVIKASALCKLYNIDNFNDYGHGNTSHNWAIGYYRLGNEVFEEVEDCVRKEIEKCECFQGFQFIHSMDGGTGSGVGSYLLRNFRDTLPDRWFSNYSIFPAIQSKHNENELTPYNVVLTMHQIIEDSDCNIIFDNEKLYKIAQSTLKQKEPTHADLNWLIAQGMNGMTAPLRYRGNRNDDLRKLCMNMLPFPRMKFFAVSHAPFFKANGGIKLKMDSEQVINQMWSNDNLMVDIDLKSGKVLTSLSSYRRNLVDFELNHKIISHFLRSSELDKHISMDIVNLFLAYYTYAKDKGVLPDYTEIFKNEQRKLHDFCKWIPENTRHNFIECAPHNTSQTGTMITSTTAITQFFRRLLNSLGAVWDFPTGEKRIGWSKLCEASLDEEEMHEAKMNLRDLIMEYDDRNNADEYYWESEDDDCF